MTKFKDRKVQAEHFAAWITEMKPDTFMTLALNNAAWRDMERGGKPMSMDVAAKKILRAAKAVDEIALGKRALKHPDDRMLLIAFPEKPHDFLHYHALVWYPNVRDVCRGLTFPWHWFENAWKEQWRKQWEKMPNAAVTVDFQSMTDRLGEESIKRATDYALKEAYKGYALTDYVISPDKGPLPRSARRALEMYTKESSVHGERLESEEE
jgi:hypothetical protein